MAPPNADDAYFCFYAEFSDAQKLPNFRFIWARFSDVIRLSRTPGARRSGSLLMTIMASPAVSPAGVWDHRGEQENRVRILHR